MPVKQQSREHWNKSFGVTVQRRTGKFYKVKEGEQLVRILTFTHTVKQGDLQLGRYNGVESGTVMEEFFVPFRKHFKGQGQPPVECGLVKKIDGSFLGTCGTCDQAGELFNSALEQDRKAAQRIKASTKYAINIVDLNNAEQQVCVWEAPGSVLESILKSMGSTAYAGEDLIGVNGRDLLVTYNKGAPPALQYTCVWLDRSKAKKLSAKGEIQDLYGIPDYVPTQFQGLVAASAPQSIGKASAASAAPKATQTPSKAQEPAEAVEEQQETIQGEPEPAAVPKGRGRPKKKVEPVAAWKVGDTVTFVDGEEKVTGEITGEYAEGEPGMWNVVAGDTEYGVAEEEFIK